MVPQCEWLIGMLCMSCGRRKKDRRVFGAFAYVHISAAKQSSKFDSRVVKMILVGYMEELQACKLLHPQTHKVIYSRSITVNEGVVLKAIDQDNTDLPQDHTNDEGLQVANYSKDLEDLPDSLTSQTFVPTPDSTTTKEAQPFTINLGCCLCLPWSHHPLTVPSSTRLWPSICLYKSKKRCVPSKNKSPQNL